MTIDIWVLVGQTFVIVLSVGASFIRLRERITALEITTGHQEKTIDRLVDKVDGISRHVAAAEG